MEKGRVVDLFTRKPLDEITQDTKTNDTEAEKGIYIGHIHPETADMVRKSEAMLEAKAVVIDKLVAEWEAFAFSHFGLLDQVLDMLNVDGYDPNTQKLSISEEGHVWIVKGQTPLG